MQVPAGILVPRKARRQRNIGMRNGGDVRVADKRQDGVIERGGGKLHLPARGKVAIRGNDASHDFSLFAADQGLVIEREAAPFSYQFANVLIMREEFFVEPCQLREHLQIAKRLRTEHAPGSMCVSPRPLPLLEQLV